MLGKAAAFCQVLAENESSRLQALAEPAAIFTIGGLVFFMVMAVIMPLLNTMDALSM
jgi:general secretion pathway protein F/type IV pilus assembly protein PilC